MLPLANILARRLRTAISVLAIGVGVALFLILVGLTSMLREIADRTASVDAHMIVWPASDQVLMSPGLPAEGARRRLASIEGVERAIPVLTNPLKLAGRNQNVYGVRPEDWHYFAKADAMVEGRPAAEGNEMVIDTRLRAAGQFHLGQTVACWGHPFRIVGIVREGVAGRVFMPFATINEILQCTSPRASFFYLRLRGPTVVQAVREAVTAQGLKPLSFDEFYQMLVSNLGDMNLVIGAVVFVAGFVCFLVILLTIYTMVIERTRQIGILRGIGASRTQVFGLILAEAGLLCLGGILVGFLMTWGGRAFILRVQPLWTVDIPAIRFVYAVALAAGGTFLGALHPALRAARQDPVECLRYE